MTEKHQLDRIEEMLIGLCEGNSNTSISKRDFLDFIMALQCDRKINAIKYFRSFTGYGLKESKDIIYSLFEMNKNNV